jgi:hypothetical protein
VSGILSVPPPAPVPADMRSTVPAESSGAEQEMLRELDGIRWGKSHRMPVVQAWEGGE